MTLETATTRRADASRGIVVLDSYEAAICRVEIIHNWLLTDAIAEASLRGVSSALDTDPERARIASIVSSCSNR
jgi:hypothetical protein